MLPMIVVREKLGTLLAADTTTLATVAANAIALIAQPFVLDENIDITTLVYATFTGSTPIPGTAGPQGVGNDPATGQQVITILAPVGGWRFVCTAPPGTPETIYGFILQNAAANKIWAAALLDTPITITLAGDEIDLGAINITFVLQPMD